MRKTWEADITLAFARCSWVFGRGKVENLDEYPSHLGTSALTQTAHVLLLICVGVSSPLPCLPLRCCDESQTTG